MMGDRAVQVDFASSTDNQTTVTVTFDAETENTLEMQKQGWSAILDNFSAHATRKYNPKNVTFIKEIKIAAPRHTVWQILTQDQYYRQWAAAFCPGSYFVGEMAYGHKIQFLAPDLSGLSSIVRVAIVDFQVSFEHLGAIIAGKEDLENAEFAGWKDARETYALTDIDGVTQLEIYQEINIHESELMVKS